MFHLFSLLICYQQNGDMSGCYFRVVENKVPSICACSENSGMTLTPSICFVFPVGFGGIYGHLTFANILSRGLKQMDSQPLASCRWDRQTLIGRAEQRAGEQRGASSLRVGWLLQQTPGTLSKGSRNCTIHWVAQQQSKIETQETVPKKGAVQT